MICGAETWKQMVEFANSKESILLNFSYMKKIYILSFLLLLILNCEKEKNENIAIFFNKTDTFFLNSESVFIKSNEDTQLNNVAEMIYIDSLLII